jgi:hypothetical protein
MSRYVNSSPHFFRPVGRSITGPNLSGIFTAFYPRTAPGSRAWDPKAVADWIRNPRAARPATLMPPVSLFGEDVRSVLATLAPPRSRTPAEEAPGGRSGGGPPRPTSAGGPV